MTYRRLLMIALGVGWVFMGVQVFFTNTPISPDRAILYEALPIPVRVALWMLTGLPAVVSGLTGKHTSFAFSLLIIMPAERLMSLLWSQLNFFWPGEPSGANVSFGIGVWSLILVALWILSKWPDVYISRRKER